MSDVVVGLDNGGTSNNATVLTLEGVWLVDRMIETPSRVEEGTEAGVAALVSSFEDALLRAAVARDAVRAVGLDTPGPAGPDGVICSAGSTNFGHPSWRGFDVRSALEDALGLPVVYNNDANAAALYAHYSHFGKSAEERSSVSAIVGTGLGGGVVVNGQVIKGAAGMAGELGHIRIPLDGLLEEGQPVPGCNCGQVGDVESFASLTAIGKNLLPFWLTRHRDHPLATTDVGVAAKQLRSYAEQNDELALAIFDQQARALGRLFGVVANFTDPDGYFIGGGVVDARPEFRQWFVEQVRRYTDLRPEQQAVATFALVPDLDMAGAKGSALAAAALWGHSLAFPARSL